MEREAKYTISIADDAHWRSQIKCQDACPVHTDARGYVRAIAEGDLERAYLIARGPNPLASICGRVCGAPCELNCRRGSLDAPVSIRALKRYAHEEYQSTDLSRQLDVIERIRESFAKRDCAGSEEVAVLAGLFDAGKVKRASGQPVAIIGSGPAGLAAAHDLVLFGFSPVIYEMESVAAGMLYLGIPEYRLPHSIIEAEVDAIRAMGVEIKTDITIGKDVQLSELMDQFAAVIVAVGAKKSRALPVPGAEGRGVYGGVDFLRAVALRRPMTLGQEVVVIGGGNVAYDVSRTALRREVESDVSRTALRLEGVKTVHLCCLEPKEAMLADEVEVTEGAEEGVILHNSYGPDEILLDESGAVRGIRMKKVLSIFDEQGRFAPSYDENDTLEIAADTVLVAIGQQSDFSFVDAERDGIEMTERGTFSLNEAHSTSREGLFVAGDAEHGPKLMIHAIASGKHAARSVYEHVLGTPLTWEESGSHFALSEYEREADYEVLPRQQPATLSPEERTRSVSLDVEQCLAATNASTEASRCLDCGVNTIFDGQKCFLCGACEEICPEQCLKLVSLDGQRGGENFFSFREEAKRAAQGQSLSGIIKNDERCTRCGLCADRCPVGAITMERYRFTAACNLTENVL